MFFASIKVKTIIPKILSTKEIFLNKYSLFKTMCGGAVVVCLWCGYVGYVVVGGGNSSVVVDNDVFVNSDDIHGCVCVADNCGDVILLNMSLPYGRGCFSDSVTLYRVSMVRHTSLNILFLFAHLQIYSLIIFNDI